MDLTGGSPMALGGSLHQDLKQRAGATRHLLDDALDADALCGPVHRITLPPGGLLRQWLQRDHVDRRDKSLHAFDKVTEPKTTWLRIAPAAPDHPT